MFIVPGTHVGFHAAAAAPALRHSRPREVSLTAGGRALVAVALLLFLAAAGVFILMYGAASRQAAERRAMVADGVMTTGVVTELWPRGDDWRRVRYQFSVDESVIRGERRVSDDRRETLLVGSPISVRYLPSDPAVNDLGEFSGSRMPMPVPFIIASIIAAVGVICLAGVSRQRRLLAEGRVAEAVVTRHHTDNYSEGGTHRSITYQFALLSGAVASGKSGASKKPPAIGTVITVVYDPDRPRRNRVYPFSLVKPAR